MDHATQVAKINQILGYVDNKTTCMVEGEYKNPVERYTDPERFDREMNLLIRRVPQIVAHVSDIPRPGDYKTMDYAGTKLLITRSADGQARVFLNVCRHRGTRLVWGEGGTGKRAFVCPYHAWTYATDGRLMGIPNAEGFPSVKKEEHGLCALQSAERQGFIYAILDPQAPAVDFDAYLGGLQHDFHHLGLADYFCYSPLEMPRKNNWKLAMDLFQENYHTRTTHTKTIWSLFLDNIAVFDHLAPHIRGIIPKRSVCELRGTDTAEWNLRAHSTLLYSVFPNTMVAVLVDHAAVFQVIPHDVATSTLNFTLLVPKIPTSDHAKEAWGKSLELVKAVVGEDSDRGEAIQSGLLSGANRHLTFGRFEQGLGWFHEAVEQAISPGLRARAAAE